MMEEQQLGTDSAFTVAHHRYFAIYKPVNMVSQFVSPHKVRLLGDLDFQFPEGTHAIGRLDNHSEGLLLLTTNKTITRLLFQGKEPHKRTYLVKVKYTVTPETLSQLREGITMPVKGGQNYTTSPCEVEMISCPDSIPTSLSEARDYVPHSWLRITLTEGKFHQIRKMVGSVHHRCKRLIRVSIEGIHLEDLQPGDVRELTEKDFFQLLKL